eukprot:579944-Pyramimonas_sp.AAC.1
MSRRLASGALYLAECERLGKNRTALAVVMDEEEEGCTYTPVATLLRRCGPPTHSLRRGVLCTPSGPAPPQ